MQTGIGWTQYTPIYNTAYTTTTTANTWVTPAEYQYLKQAAKMLKEIKASAEKEPDEKEFIGLL